VAGYSRKELKKDKFAEEVKHGFDFLSSHREQTTRYGAIGAAVILIGGGIYFYMHYQAGVREEALAQALRIDNATVGNAAAPQPGLLHYDTPEQKEQARVKALADIATKYHGTQEGAIAEFQIASDTLDKGDIAGAEKRYKDIVDNAPDTYASMARLSLAKLYESENKTAEAEKLLREAVNKPSVSVSKEEATIQLALLIGKSKPDEARKMLEPLRTSRTAISRAAVQALGDVQNIH
jgi:predicted negative regulator of RcsB-dependent stress response